MLSSTRPPQLPPSSSSPSSPPHIPSSPPSIMTDVRRRLSSRRGSMSASDPFGLHADAETPRSTSARLTIVRVPFDPTSDSMPTGPPSRPESLRRMSGGSTHSTSSSIGGGGGGGSAPGSGGRMSFAFSTFTPINKDTEHKGSPPPSPQLSRRHRSGSNTSISERPFRDSFYGRQASLTPAQIYDLAASATKPPPLPTSASRSRPGTPGIGASASGASVGAASAFTPLPEDYFLPFLDRASEVTALLSKPPTNRLIALLAQTFHSPTKSSSTSLPTSTSTSEKAPHNFEKNPTKWTFAELEAWLKTIDRNEADDRIWIYKARACVRSRSELIWERLKGALGVPPDFDEEFAEEDAEAEAEAELEAGGGTGGELVGEVEDVPKLVAEPASETEAELDPEAEVEEPEEEEDEQNRAFLEPIHPGSPPILSPLSPLIQSTSDDLFGFGGRDGGMENIGEAEAEEDETGSKVDEEEKGELPICGLRISTTSVVVDPPPPIVRRGSGSAGAADRNGGTGLGLSAGTGPGASVSRSKSLTSFSPSPSHTSALSTSSSISASASASASANANALFASVALSPSPGPISSDLPTHTHIHTNPSSNPHLDPQAKARIGRRRSFGREGSRQVRDPGNPLFPGSFASLTVKPNLVSRSVPSFKIINKLLTKWFRNLSHRVPPAHYIPPIFTSHRSGFKYNRGREMEKELRGGGGGEDSAGGPGSGNDYAITWSSDSERSFVGR
ncbi:hypothetical protein SISNIDRAFT_489694 [Sistotremastrum niveocremeum HHB9708]|uniref:Uncharacterized protein n=1 Tax=Sistotremastrum niveocremeum HHB9708 TaxID=1314777 RepID=A0A164PLJ9_9AGAM|nr:hypothetical protein SISNIDRAFT_489694 [Sistotremastrum niveocremeum HHB9708]